MNSPDTTQHPASSNPADGKQVTSTNGQASLFATKLRAAVVVRGGAMAWLDAIESVAGRSLV